MEKSVLDADQFDGSTLYARIANANTIMIFLLLLLIGIYVVIFFHADDTSITIFILLMDSRTRCPHTRTRHAIPWGRRLFAVDKLP